ncbi:transglutaminase domain-containing protein [Croceivirga thetidis]|uniref:Transglutaminase-like domain-containing protein n=1 Tax=Croceivirga thetidis TaxID=2721623 RepID=A0ABX1GWJ3_9FLAO|nr:transglutaminase domain-containing protein [Croceivirga thetidis]NKI33255.1 hypothetical protein [Croceivirga thetidis]
MKSPLILFLISSILYCQPTKSDAFDFSKADSIAISHSGDDLYNLPRLVYNLTFDLESEPAKFRAIYYWVCSNIKNDYSSFKKTISKRKKYDEQENKFLKWNTKYLPKVFKRLISQKKTSCTGYAYLIKEMAILAGLECELVNGFAKTASTHLSAESKPNHSWNAIRLNGRWYLCDATWSAGKVKLENNNPSFEFDFSDGYFLSPPELFAKNHYPLEKKWLLLQEPFGFNAFLQGPLVYKGAFENGITPLQPDKMFLNVPTKKNIEFELAVNPLTKVDSLELVLVSGDKKTRIKPFNLEAENRIAFSCSFGKKGRYDVHVVNDETIIATYVVDVTKNSSYP